MKKINVAFLGNSEVTRMIGNTINDITDPVYEINLLNPFKPLADNAEVRRGMSQYDGVNVLVVDSNRTINFGQYCSAVDYVVVSETGTFWDIYNAEGLVALETSVENALYTVAETAEDMSERSSFK